MGAQLERYYSLGDDPTLCLEVAYIVPKELEVPIGQGDMYVLEAVAQVDPDLGRVRQMLSVSFYKTNFPLDWFRRYWGDELQGVLPETLGDALKTGLLCEAGINATPETDRIGQNSYPFKDVFSLLEMASKPDPDITSRMAGFYRERNPSYYPISQAELVQNLEFL